MAFRLEFAAEAERDFGLIFDHLVRSYLDFGESPQSALDRAEARTGEDLYGPKRVASDWGSDSALRVRMRRLFRRAQAHAGRG